jgi:DNA-binding response OmpR family regulator
MRNTKKSILVVDDDVDILELTKAHLEAAGFGVVCAGSEKEAELMLKSFKPDLAVLDLMMENQDSGFILGYKIKKKDPRIPVIIVTAVTSQTGIDFDVITGDESTWIRADAIIEKDIRYEQLVGEVNRLIGGGLDAVSHRPSAGIAH